MSNIRNFEVIKFKTITTRGGRADTALLQEINGGIRASASSYLYRGRECHYNDFRFKPGMKISTSAEINVQTGKDGKSYNKLGYFVLQSETDLLIARGATLKLVDPVSESKPEPVKVEAPEKEPEVKRVKSKVDDFKPLAPVLNINQDEPEYEVSDETCINQDEPEYEVSDETCERLTIENGYNIFDDEYAEIEAFGRKGRFDDEKGKHRKNTRRHNKRDQQ